VAINPPYGLRLKSPEDGHGFYENILRQFMRHYSGWTFLLVLPDKNALKILPSKAIHRVLTLFHGGLNVFLVAGRI
jgi:23S rRNA G2445 N2-methylase RlmL